MRGNGAGFVPDTLNTKIYDSVFRVTNEAAYSIAAEIARTEDLLVGISSGAADVALTAEEYSSPDT